MVAEHKFKIALACAPSSWKYTPVLFKGGFIDGWPDLFFSVEDAIAKGTNYINPETKKITTLTGIGVHLNPMTETCGFDFDGVGSNCRGTALGIEYQENQQSTQRALPFSKRLESPHHFSRLPSASPSL